MELAGYFWYFSNMEPIHNYNLFGEHSDLPDVVHCELIELRSLLHNWEFAAHRHAHLHQILLIEDGGGEARIEGETYDLSNESLVNVPRGTVHGFKFFEGTHGWVVTLASELLEESLHDNEGLTSLLNTPLVFKSNPAIRQVILDIFEEYPERNFARAHILRAHSTLLAGMVARAMAEKGEPQVLSGGSLTASALARRFEALVDQHYREHLGIADYAELLLVSPTHLSRVMKQATGRPASAAISERVMREARRNLTYSNLSVSELAYQLGFSDPAYFSRAFARETGQPPSAFRNRIKNQKST